MGMSWINPRPPARSNRGVERKFENRYETVNVVRFRGRSNSSNLVLAPGETDGGDSGPGRIKGPTRIYEQREINNRHRNYRVSDISHV